jgi:hypothetical protein
MANKIQLRRDSAANWAAFNPVLADGEIGIDTTNGYMKFGDGTSPWTECMYVRFPGVGPDNLSVTGTPGAGTVGQAYSFVPTITGGAGGNTVTSIGASLPAGTTLNSSTGAITGTLTGSAATYAGIILRVTDVDGNVATLNLSAITVSAGAVLTISGTPSASATVGTPYTFTPSSTGGTAPKTYALIAGTLPAGLSLNTSTGAITGTPTTAATASGLSLRVTDAVAATATLATFSITVAAAVANSKARFGTGSATAGVSTPAALIASMTEYGSANASKAGSFNVAAGGAGVYGYAAIEAGASASGVTFTDNLGTGGWQGASSAGNNGSDPGTSPNTSVVTYTDSNGVTWRIFRLNYANAAWNGTTS